MGVDTIDVSDYTHARPPQVAELRKLTILLPIRGVLRDALTTPGEVSLAPPHLARTNRYRKASTPNLRPFDPDGAGF